MVLPKCWQLLTIALLCSCIAFSRAYLATPATRSMAFKTRASSTSIRAVGKRSEPIPENETADEQRARLSRKAKKMMFNENGVAYAPWISKQIDEDAIVENLIKQEKGILKKDKTSILDRGEIESSEGMKWRMQGNQVDLLWITGGEANNMGFIVEKRPSYGGDFQEVASFNEVLQLVSRGATGGRYRYTDPSTAPGSWIYRIQDCDQLGSKSVLCQCFVEVQTETESKSQAVVAVALVAFFAVAAAIGFSLDPPR